MKIFDIKTKTTKNYNKAYFKKKNQKKRKAEKGKSIYNRISLKQKLRPSKPKMKTKIVKKVNYGLNHFESACLKVNRWYFERRSAKRLTT